MLDPRDLPAQGSPSVPDPAVSDLAGSDPAGPNVVAPGVDVQASDGAATGWAEGVLAADILVPNTATLVGGLLAIAALFLIVGFLVRRLFARLGRLESLERARPALDAVRVNLRVLLTLLFFATTLSWVGFGAWLWIRGEHLPQWGRAQLAAVPDDFWLDLGVAAGKVLALLTVVWLVLKPTRRMLNALCTKAQDYDGLKANDESVQEFFDSLTRIVTRGAWLYAAVLSTSWLLPGSSLAGALAVALHIYLIMAVGLLLWRGVDTLIESLDALSLRFSSPDNALRYYDKLRHLVPLFRRAVEYVLVVFFAALAIQQIDSVEHLAEWSPRIIQAIGVAFLARVIVELARLLSEEFLIKRANLDGESLKRRKTIIPLIQSLLAYLIYFGAGIVILETLTIETMPILAGAGILGLAIGLGAQGLINDMLSGFFILFEDYYLVGDFVGIATVEGTVERVDLRTTRLRDNDGRHHIIRNGLIENVVNYSKEFTFAVVEVGVAFESDLDAVHAALEAAGKLLHERNDDVIEPTVVKGLKTFGESAMDYRTITRVKPGRHKQVERDLRALIKVVFDERGIEIPYARRVLIMHGADDEAAARAAGDAFEPQSDPKSDRD